MKQEEQLQEIQSQCGAAIVYQPFDGEVDVFDVDFPVVLPEEKIVLPSSSDSDPFEWAKICSERYQDKKCCVFVPGSKFDKFGTRHGRGGGWYDKFLSQIPSSWIRVGVCFESQLSPVPLVRQPWDEPVGWMVVKGRREWEVARITPGEILN